MTNIRDFDIADYLDSEERIAGYLSAILEEEDPQLFITALSHVAKARGMTQIAKDSGLGRESLYKALREGSKLRYETVQKILSALGVQLTITPKTA